MKKILLILLFAVVLLAVAGAFVILGPATNFRQSKYDLFVKTGTTYPELLERIRSEQILKFPAIFDQLARRADYPQKIKAGKYGIKKGESLLNILKMLRNGRQEPVNLVITKLRTREDFAGLVGRKLECDSASFLAYILNADSLRGFGLDSNTVMTAVLPDTYTFYWNTTASRVFRKIQAASEKYWTPEHKSQAEARKLTPVTAYIMASIVEEETTRKTDKPLIASVYLNRIATGMKLGADPTVKFAMHNFELKRVYSKYLLTESPYNTYKYAGLPPGPICTPSPESLQAVLGAPETKFLYFVARPDFTGYSNFAETYTQHMQFAKAYQQALDEQIRISQSGKPHS